jgi:hypothetical protein
VGTVSARPSRAIWTIQTSKLVDSSKCVDGVSPAFTARGYRWRLVLKPFEYCQDALSVYLEIEDADPSIPAAYGVYHHEDHKDDDDYDNDDHGQNLPAVSATFVLSTRHPTGHQISMTLAHEFTTSCPSWGVQDMLFLEDVAALLRQNDSVSIDVQFTDLRDLRKDQSSVLPTHVDSRGGRGALDIFPTSKYILLGYHMGRPVHLASTTPRIVLMEDFVGPKECQALIKMASPLLQRSRVSSGTETKSRTSSGCFFTGAHEKHPAVIDIEQRISRLLENTVLRRVDAGGEGGRLRAPLHKTEALQAVQYDVGQEYREHFDNRAGSVHLRAATVIIYLGDCTHGGATYFPKGLGGQKDGIRVRPKRGRCLVFWSRREDGTEDAASLHAAEPVLKGTKWIATRWLREDA